MNAAQFADYAARFRRTGLVYARKNTDASGNVTGQEELPWEAVLVKILGITGWVLLDENQDRETPVISIFRSKEAVRE